MPMFEGSSVALVTPMRADGGIDWSALDGLLEWHLESGTRNIVSMGTTGESATLSTEEHLEVIARTVKVIAGRVPVIAGTGSNATSEAVHQTQAAQALGADAGLLVTPYYNRPTQEGLYRHYLTVAQACELPLLLYNIPARTAVDMSAETVARLAPLDNVIGIKEACGDPQRVAAIRATTPEDFLILSGEDGQTLEMMKLGARGVISVTANVCPQEMSAFCEAYLAGDTERATALDDRLQPLHEALFVEPSPTATKWVLEYLGRTQGGIRLPLMELSEAHHARMIEVLRELGVA